MASVVGIEKLKQASLLGIQLGNAIETTLEDGFKLADLANFILPLSQLPAVIENKALIVEEFKDLDEAEKTALINYIKTNLDLKNDKVEVAIEKGLIAIVAVLELVNALKKEDTPEEPKTV